jgi:hypothetical protein
LELGGIRWQCINFRLPPTENSADSGTAATKGLRQFLIDEQQHAWLEGEATPADATERHDSLEQRFQYVGRLEALLAARRQQTS